MAFAKRHSKNNINNSDVTRYLINKSLSISTRNTYSNAYKLFDRFSESHNAPNLANSLPIDTSRIVAFISYMFCHCYASSSIITYVAAISFIHKLGNWPDPANCFTVQKMLLGIQKERGNPDCRKPIYPPLLKKLVCALSSLEFSSFTKCLFRSMFLLAFHAFLHVGEITLSPSGHKNLLKISDVKLKRDTLELHLRSYKHSLSHLPKILILKSQREKILCPVIAVKNYLNYRGSSDGPLFITEAGKPLSRAHFLAVLKSCFKTLRINGNEYNTHSFRVGAASWAAINGMSDSQIKEMGRWRSDAYKRYIRLGKIMLNYSQ